MRPQYHLGGLSAFKKLSRCSGSGVVRKWIVWARLGENINKSPLLSLRMFNSIVGVNGDI